MVPEVLDSSPCYVLCRDVPGVVVGTCILIIGSPPRPPRERGILKYISTIICSIRGSRWLSFIVLCIWILHST